MDRLAAHPNKVTISIAIKNYWASGPYNLLVLIYKKRVDTDILQLYPECLILFSTSVIPIQ